MISTKYHKFEQYKNAEYTSGLEGQIATQLMRMYRSAMAVTNPVVLELGAAEGASTTVFLQACEDDDGQLVSVDIRDCSDISQWEHWQFVKSDSTGVDFVLAAAPQLAAGIDIFVCGQSA